MSLLGMTLASPPGTYWVLVRQITNFVNSITLIQTRPPSFFFVLVLYAAPKLEVKWGFANTAK